MNSSAGQNRFLDLIRVGELRPMDSEEYYLDYQDHLYVLAPRLEFDEDEGETVTTGYILMRIEDGRGAGSKRRPTG